jgi:hypothetical protein
MRPEMVISRSRPQHSFLETVDEPLEPRALGDLPDGEARADPEILDMPHGHGADEARRDDHCGYSLSTSARCTAPYRSDGEARVNAQEPDVR